MQPEELKAVREAAGMTQQQFAERLGINRVTLADMERGSAPIERRTIEAVEMGLRFRIDVADSRPHLGWTVTIAGPGRPPRHRVHQVVGSFSSEKAALEKADELKRDTYPLARIIVHRQT